MTIFGALYQLLPVALGVSIRSETWGHVSFWTFAPGVALFATGVATGSFTLRHMGIALLTIGILSLVINVALSLRHVATRDVIWSAIAIALTFLTITLTLGATLLHNLHTNFLAAARVRVLATHLHVALLGWVLMMIIGISYRLLPMFLLAHDNKSDWTRRALGLLTVGVVTLGAGIPSGKAALLWTGLVLVEAAIVCFVIQARRFYAARKRPRLDAGLRHAATALAFLIASAVIAPIVLIAGSAGHQRLDTVYVIVGLLGGLALYVVGQFYKIVPFLVWIARFRNQMGRTRVPTVAQLYSQTIASADLVLLTTAIAGLALGVALGTTILVRGAAVLFVAGVALFISQMTRVVFGTPSVEAPRVVATSPVTPLTGVSG
jgi:hypothetical protein